MLSRCHLFAVGLLGLLAAVASSAGTAAAPDAAGLAHRVRVLAAAEMSGRGNGTAEALAAADTIAAWFADAGLSTVPSREGWFQDFPLPGDEAAGFGRSVLGWLPGMGVLAARIMVIGAHYDHLGVRLADDGETVIGIYHGAEDNASGVSVLVELAGLLAAGPGDERRSCLFVAFAGEEIGLLGSSWLVEHPPWPAGAVDLMMNLDSVGRLRGDRLYVGGLGSSPVLRTLVTDANAGHGLRLEMSDSGWDASDHVPFDSAGIPVLFLFTGPHPQYHSTADRWELVSGEGLARVASYAGDLAAAARLHPGAIPYTAQAELPPRAPAISGRERAWLGTIPDFVEGVDGVRLAGVMPGGPAEESGLQAGDVLVQLGDRTITGLQDLTAALQENG
ncbi:M28 family peptidase, partial [bacterium]|nr:M28 family peptidase [bacterium]